MDASFSHAGWECCPRCRHYRTCVTKWIRGERHLPQHCCSRCQHAEECYEELPEESQFAGDPWGLDETPREEAARILSEHGYLCCPGCSHYGSCRILEVREEKELPRACCPQCEHIMECFSMLMRRLGADGQGSLKEDG